MHGQKTTIADEILMQAVVSRIRHPMVDRIDRVAVSISTKFNECYGWSFPQLQLKYTQTEIDSKA